MRKKFKKGFTLLEIAISLGLMAIILIPTGNMVMGSVKTNKSAENKQQASMLLQETVEYLKTASDLNDQMLIEHGIEVVRDSSKDADGKEYYKINRINPNEYGFTVEGGVYIEKIKNVIVTPGDAYETIMGASDMNVIAKVERDESGKEVIKLTGNNISIKDAVNGNMGENVTSIDKGNLNLTFNGNGKINVDIKGSGSFTADPKDNSTEKDIKNVLFIIDANDLNSNNENKLEVSSITLNGQVNNQTITIWLYIINDDGTCETVGEYFDKYLPIADPSKTTDNKENNGDKKPENVGSNKPTGYSFNKKVFNLDLGDDTSDEIWTNLGSETITIMESYTVELEALKKGKVIDSISTNLAK